MSWSLFLLNACATEPVAAPAAPSPAPEAAPAPARPRPDREDDAKTFEGTTGVTDVPAPGTQNSTLDDLDAKKGKGAFDRAVFTFQGGLPGYRVRYLDSMPLGCASGEPVEVEGKAWLEVRFVPAVAHTEEGKPTLESNEIPLDLGVMRELQSTCDFEGEVVWVVGLADKKPYRVVERKEQSRIVLDIQH